jgi:hypothetical protein
MIAVRLDESGTHDDSPVCVVAGYLADSGGIERLESEWKDALLKHNHKRIHMRELEYGRTNKLPAEKKIALYKSLIEVLRRHAFAGLGGYVLRSDYDKYVVKSEYARYYSPYSLCLMLCAHAAQVWANTHGRSSEPISFVLDSGSGYGRDADLMFRLMMSSEWKTRYNFEPLIWGDDNKFVSLQAADMIAFEARKHALMYHKLPQAGPKLRELLKGLLGSVPHVSLTPDERFWISIGSGIYPVDLLSPNVPYFPDLSKHPPKWNEHETHAKQ